MAWSLRGIIFTAGVVVLFIAFGALFNSMGQSNREAGIGLGYEIEGRHMDRDATRSYRPCR